MLILTALDCLSRSIIQAKSKIISDAGYRIFAAFGSLLLL